MKKTLLFFLILFVFTISVSAHSGKTDANGGHYNRSTGEYHYHHGYSAHQHINGVCPYDFDDQAEYRSTTDSSISRPDDYPSSSPKLSKPPKISAPSTSNTAENKGSLSSMEASVKSSTTETLTSKYWWISIILVFFFLLKAYRTSCRRNKELSRKNEELTRKNEELTRKNAEEAARYARTQQLLHSLFAGQRLSELSPPPHPSDFVNSKGLPCGPGPGPWGADYTVYLTSLKSPVFHRRQFCSTSYGLPINIVQVGTRRPCTKCYKSSPPDLKWYYRQIEILKLCNECGIELSHEPFNPDDP